MDSELLEVQSSGNPRISLVSAQLTGNTYLAWSLSIKLALGLEMKLKFINGKSVKPSADTKEFEQWQRANYLVTSCILNSISKEIVEAFLYTTSAQELLLELEACFGECNRLQIYQLQREISSIK
ncbi:UNVERIFIED_CONTAM: hypothetical protein Sindi_1350500 [Sesamum indicum]